jgi:hypothetical protein
VPLPASPHAVYEVLYRMVTAEGFVSWEGNLYSGVARNLPVQFGRYVRGKIW